MISVDAVYQTVLTLANKEQRGYITPQEFNILATQAQMDIFEQYFYDINQFGRVPGNNTEYSDMLNYLEEKISVFETSKQININSAKEFYNVSAQIPDLYRFGSILYSFENTNKLCEKVNANLVDSIVKSPLLKPNRDRPIYTLKDGKIYMYPSFIEEPIIVNYIKKPKDVKWTYLVVDAKPLYNGTATDLQDFELHVTEQVDLVIKILTLAGVTLKDPNLYQIAAAEDNKNIQQEKQ